MIIAHQNFWTPSAEPAQFPSGGKVGPSQNGVDMEAAHKAKQTEITEPMDHFGAVNFAGRNGVDMPSAQKAVVSDPVVGDSEFTDKPALSKRAENPLGTQVRISNHQL